MPFYNFCRKSVKKNYLNSCKKSSIKQDKYIEDKRIKALEKSKIISAIYLSCLMLFLSKI